MVAILLVTGLCAGAAVPAAAVAQPRSKTCPAKPHTLLKASEARVWRVGRVLWSCVVLGNAAPKTHRLGAWTRGTQLFLEGIELAWTTRRTSAGATSDRIWAANTYTGERSMTDLPLVPASGALPAREARLQRLVGVDSAVLAWVTQSGDVVMAQDEPQDDPTPAGALAGRLVPDRQRLLVASYPGMDPFVLGSSLHLFAMDGDGDECETVSDYGLTFVDGTSHATGVIWSGGARNPLCQQR